MKKFFSNTVFITGLFFILPIVVGIVSAAGITFDPTTVTTTANGQFQMKINVNAGSEQITGTDAYVTFDAASLRADSVAAGSFFPTVTNNITSGRVYIAGLVDDPATSKTGSGLLATISFTALKDGTATLSIDCTNSKVVKNDINATNVIVCSENGTSTVTIGTGSSGGTNTGGDADQPTALPQSGIFNNVVKWAVPGTVLVILGIVMRLVI